MTYVLAGSSEHRDHKGNHGLLTAGSVQWMTAGRGIIHSGILFILSSILHNTTQQSKYFAALHNTLQQFITDTILTISFRNAKAREWTHVGISVVGQFTSKGQNGI